jgi:ABC-type sulfate/molybdate transport systems ATPase subunit
MVERALEWAGLGGLGGRTVRELSRGQRRRATLAAAAIGTPSCLLLDEPLDGMDRAFRSEIIRWLVGHLEAGALALVVSHDLEPFAELADRAVTVRQGRCQLVDPLPPVGPERLEVLEGLARGG